MRLVVGALNFHRVRAAPSRTAPGTSPSARWFAPSRSGGALRQDARPGSRPSGGSGRPGPAGGHGEANLCALAGREEVVSRAPPGAQGFLGDTGHFGPPRRVLPLALGPQTAKFGPAGDGTVRDKKAAAKGQAQWHANRAGPAARASRCAWRVVGARSYRHACFTVMTPIPRRRTSRRGSLGAEPSAGRTAWRKTTSGLRSCRARGRPGLPRPGDVVARRRWRPWRRTGRTGIRPQCGPGKPTGTTGRPFIGIPRGCAAPSTPRVSLKGSTGSCTR